MYIDVYVHIINKYLRNIFKNYVFIAFPHGKGELKWNLKFYELWVHPSELVGRFSYLVIV